MKMTIIVVALLAGALSSTSPFYRLSYTSLDGTQVSMFTLTNRKIILFPFKGAHPDVALLRFLDSVGTKNKDSVTILAFPALELDSSATIPAVTRMHDSLGLKLAMAQPSRVQKSAGPAQNPVFQWLTSMDQNKHFNRDVEEEGQLFFISRRGNLYSVINKSAARAVTMRVIQTAVKE